MKKKYAPKTEKWFLKRVGKRIYRDVSLHYCCSTCDDVAKNGLIVQDKNHASYLAMVDANFGAEGVFSNYRDKK